MGFDGSGNYTRTNGTQTGSTLWQDRAAIAPATISASEHDAEMNDVATALTACLKADGSKTAINNQPMGGFKHTGVADATLANQYATLGQVQTGLSVNDLVVNANNATVGLRVTQTGSGEALRVEDSANPDSTPFVITAGGDVGIGTASPSVKLQVEGEAIININSANTGVRITQTGAGDAFRVEDSTNPDSSPFLITADGKCAIGATSPGSATLYVNGEIASATTVGSLGTITAVSSILSSTEVIAPTVVGGTDSSKPIASAEVGVIRGVDSNGSSSNAAGGTLKIAGGRATGNAAGGPIIFETSAAGVSGFTVQTSTERLRINANGDVGIGTASPDAKLSVNGIIKTTATGASGNISVNGRGINYAGATLAGTGNDMALRWNNPDIVGIVDNAVSAVLGTASDYRLKANFTKIDDQKALDDIIRLDPGTFNPVSFGGEIDETRISIGMIAHKVAEIIPEVVSGDKDAANEQGDPIYQSVNYAGLVPHLVASIKALVKRVEELEARLIS